MGLKLRFSIFRDVRPEQVVTWFEEFYRASERTYSCEQQDERRWSRWDFHALQNGWTIVNVGYTASVEHRREWRAFHRSVCEALDCLGLLLFVYDGDYWGYELVVGATPLNQFVQCDEGEVYWDPGTNLAGDAGAFENYLPWMTREIVEPYLVQRPSIDLAGGLKEMHQIVGAWNVKAHPDDEYTRGDECAILDFLRLLKIQIREDDGFIRFSPDRYSSVWTKNLRDN